MNQTQGMILGIIRTKEMIPSQIVDQVERLAPLWYASRTNVYRELRNLVKDELVEASEPVESLRWATSYKITAEGIKAYDLWRQEVEPREYLQDPILLRCALDTINTGKFTDQTLKSGAAAYKKLMDKVFTSSDDRFVPLIKDYYHMMWKWMAKQNADTTGVST